VQRKLIDQQCMHASLSSLGVANLPSEKKKEKEKVGGMATPRLMARRHMNSAQGI